MTRALIGIGIAILLVGVTSGQSRNSAPGFELTDVHTSPPTTTPAMRVATRAGRYEIRNATMVDLIRTAYSVDADNVLGGPSWLEYDRYDVVALMPPNATPDAQKTMLQALLAERFKLAVRRDTKPVAGLVLSLGKGKHKLKEAADPNAAPGCQSQSGPASSRPGAPGVPAQLILPTTTLVCRNVTMERFASDLKRLANGYVTNAVLDQTDLKGSWDFDVKFTPQGLLGLANSQGASVISLADAIDGQLGLKLDEQKIPTPVIVVEEANEKPTPNASDVAAKLPPLPSMEFDVADIKAVDPNNRGRGVQVGVMPGGRVNLPGIPLKLVIMIAWGLPTIQSEQLIGAPKWLDSANFDIIGKLRSDLTPSTSTNVSLLELGPALQALLIDRFKMKVHFEDRSVNAYRLVAVKPKLKKAEPSTRTGCKAPTNSNPVLISSSGMPARTFNCQNISMAQFADQLQVIAGPYIGHPIVDGTGLAGAWDFTLSFSPIPPAQLAGLTGLRGAPPPGAGAGPADAIADPIGGGTSLFDAVEKQLGLKLEPQKRTYPVFVIDHIEDKPTDN